MKECIFSPEEESVYPARYSVEVSRVLERGGLSLNSIREDGIASELGSEDGDEEEEGEFLLP